MFARQHLFITFRYGIKLQCTLYIHTRVRHIFDTSHTDTGTHSQTTKDRQSKYEAKASEKGTEQERHLSALLK